MGAEQFMDYIKGSLETASRPGSCRPRCYTVWHDRRMCPVLFCFCVLCLQESFWHCVDEVQRAARILPERVPKILLHKLNALVQETIK